MLLLSIFVAIIAVVLILLLNWFLSLSKYAGLRTVPGPKPLPIIGNATEIGLTTVDLLQSFMKLQNKYGTFYKFWAGATLHMMLAKPEYLEQLLTSSVHLRKSDGYDLTRSWLGDGLLTSTGQKWRSRRKMITPTFHFKILEDFMTVFNKQFDIMLDILKDEVKNNEGQSIDIEEITTLASLDIICETAFGIPIQAQFKGNPEFVHAVSGFMEIVMIRTFSPWLRNPSIFRMTSHYTKHKKYLKTLLDLPNKVINERKAEWKTKQENSQRVGDDGIKRKAALLDMLLEATLNGEQLSNEDIREEIATFMFEGHDTVSSAICFTLFALSRNEDIQQKVYNEVVDIIGTEIKSEITITQINDLKYLDMVVKESLRIYPSVPLIERAMDDEWTIDGITVPKGTTISIFIYGMHHWPEIFPEPDRFDPERFLPEKQSSRHFYSYIPFSAGFRNCIVDERILHAFNEDPTTSILRVVAERFDLKIWKVWSVLRADDKHPFHYTPVQGQKFALLELKTCIIKCLMNFKLLPDLDFEPEIGMCAVLRSKNGIKMKLRPRKKN